MMTIEAQDSSTTWTARRISILLVLVISVQASIHSFYPIINIFTHQFINSFFHSFIYSLFLTTNLHFIVIKQSIAKGSTVAYVDFAANKIVGNVGAIFNGDGRKWLLVPRQSHDVNWDRRWRGCAWLNGRGTIVQKYDLHNAVIKAVLSVRFILTIFKCVLALL